MFNVGDMIYYKGAQVFDIVYIIDADDTVYKTVQIIDCFDWKIGDKNVISKDSANMHYKLLTEELKAELL